jgi:hypothetical protein
MPMMPCRGFVRRNPIVLGILFSCFLFAIHSSAQQIAKNEFTVSANVQTYGNLGCALIGSGPFCNPFQTHYIDNPTPSFIYTRNLSPSLAIVGTFKPTSQFLDTNSFTAGRETLALGGVKTGWRGKRFGFYGEVQAGVASFSCGTWYYDPKPYAGCARLTNFALEYGGSAEYHLTSRYAVRLDAGHLEMTEFDHVLTHYSDGSPAYYREGAILQHFDARIGITRSFGHLEDVKPEPVPDRRSWDTGVIFALQPRIQPFWQFLDPYPQWGVWGSWNFSQHVSWDTTLLHSPRNPGKIEDIDFWSGGRAFEALTGAKIGVRRDHMGYFAKIRTGTITFGKTERQIYENANGQIAVDDGMFTNFALDAGGVFEVYPSRHSILRVDAGNTTIFYQPKTVISLGQKISISGETQPTMLITVGAGFRF